ncbi:hypothetical protein [Alkaliphilus sp. B6464]|uniref:hypothetical protein n=1 Tax=Alkaliphilus sp. B6464 TaxID=2731219 RepID=UPI001BA74B52|nr:hypothetical protein [Alkaliphilus sp. B6464]QUH20393.1 hypothetical protein HYG84_11125 [Alkaliphilus sp. B6464]
MYVREVNFRGAFSLIIFLFQYPNTSLLEKARFLFVGLRPPNSPQEWDIHPILAY